MAARLTVCLSAPFVAALLRSSLSGRRSCVRRHPCQSMAPQSKALSAVVAFASAPGRQPWTRQEAVAALSGQCTENTVYNAMRTGVQSGLLAPTGGTRGGRKEPLYQLSVPAAAEALQPQPPPRTGPVLPVSPPQPPALALPRLSQAFIGAELPLPAPAPAVLVPPEPASRHPAELLPHVASQRLPSAVAPAAAGPRCSAGAGESAVPLGDFEAALQVSRLLCLFSSQTADEHNKHSRLIQGEAERQAAPSAAGTGGSSGSGAAAAATSVQEAGCYASLFSGSCIGDRGFTDAGWRCVMLVESSEVGGRLCAAHHPGVPVVKDGKCFT